MPVRPAGHYNNNTFEEWKFSLHPFACWFCCSSLSCVILWYRQLLACHIPNILFTCFNYVFECMMKSAISTCLRMPIHSILLTFSKTFTFEAPTREKWKYSAPACSRQKKSYSISNCKSTLGQFWQCFREERVWFDKFIFHFLFLAIWITIKIL